MKKIITVMLLILGTFGLLAPEISLAKSRGSAYYRSAKTGRYTTKSYSNSHKSTTYKSYRRSYR